MYVRGERGWGVSNAVCIEHLGSETTGHLVTNASIYIYIYIYIYICVCVIRYIMC